MKKNTLFLFFISFSFVGFAQNTTNQQLKTEKSTIAKVVISKENQASSYAKGTLLRKPGEKIQTTVNGVVVSQQNYQPAYPTRLYEPKPEPAPIKEIKNN